MRSRLLTLVLGSICLLSLGSGCQSMKHWWHNDKRVGPDYGGPTARTGQHYNDVDSPKIDPSRIPNPEWWHLFNDPLLTQLVNAVYDQNLTLKSANCRIAEARAIRDIAAANLFPQSQAATAQYSHAQLSTNRATSFPGIPLTTNDWSVGFDASWEVDLWGRIRRSVDAADANLQAAIHDYDFALVTLIGDVGSLYIQIRSLDERLRLAKKNVELQQGSHDIAKNRFKEGRTSKLDVVQAEANRASTESLIPQLELARRQSLNALAVLIGIPPNEITPLFETAGTIPEIPYEAIVGIPANLLRSRPDIRAAERRLAAQFEQIGIAEAELYPTLSIGGNLGWQAASVSDLFESDSFAGAIGPGFRWKILNYGRLRNGVLVEQTRVNQLCFDFQNQVLGAQREVEDSIAKFIKSSEQYQFDKQVAESSSEAVELAQAMFKEGKDGFNRVFVVQSSLVQAQDRLVATKATIAIALIETYKGLGGGWQIRTNPDRFATYVSEANHEESPRETLQEPELQEPDPQIDSTDIDNTDIDSTDIDNAPLDN